MQIDALDPLLDETIVLGSAQLGGTAPEPPRMTSAPPPRAPQSAPPPRASVRPDIPRIDVEADDGDAATTIFRDPLEEVQLEALKRRLRGDTVDDGYDANETREFQRMRAVQLEDLEGLLAGASNGAAPPDANTTIQLDAIDDGKLDELEASLEVEKRTRDVRKMSAALHDSGRVAAVGPRGAMAPRASTTKDVDAEMFVALWRDVVSAWWLLVEFARGLVRFVLHGLRRIGGRAGGRGLAPMAGPDDTVPPMSRPAARKRSGGLKAR